MRRIQLSAVLGMLLIVGLAAHGAQATDGVKLVKQPKTFPITISAPGSYRLKTNLTVPDANTTAILVQADNVTIDLNGFSILGPTVCSGSPLNCSPVGSGLGVDGGSFTNIAVMNGTVRGMGGMGISTTHGRVQEVRAFSNGGSGIGGTGLMVNCEAEANGATGIVGGTVTNCKAQGNGGEAGIDAFSVTNSQAFANAGIGIVGAVVTNCTAFNNGSDGITSITTAIGNTSYANDGYGLTLTGNPKAGYLNNVMNGNQTGAVNGALGTNMGHNLCNGSLCP